MRLAPNSLALLIVPFLLVGCGGSTPELTEEQKAPDYGKKSQDKMIGMYGAPDPKKKVDTRSAGEIAADKMKGMYNGKK